MAYDVAADVDTRIDLPTIVSAVMRRLPRILALTVIALAITYAILAVTPRQYDSTAGILVEPRANAYSRATGEQAPQITGGEAGVVSSQIELLRSRDTLLRVIDATDLRSVPEFTAGAGGFSPLAIIARLLGQPPGQEAGDAVILQNLIDRMSVVQQRDSRVLTVTVTSRDPDLAARLANAIANAHVQRRAELSISDTAEASGWLLEEIEKLRVTVAEAEQAVAEFRVANDLFTGANNTSLIDQQLSTIASQINAAQERKNAALTRANLIRQMIDQGQAIDSVSDIQGSAVVQRLSEERARLQGERAQLAATLLPNHPNLRAIVAQIGELDVQLRSEAVRIADALEAEAEIEAGIEAALNDDLERIKQGAGTATRENVTLQGLIREATAQRDLLESYLRRYSEAASRSGTDSALPDVRVISVAAPAVNPSSPQVTMIMLLVAFAMITAQVGAVIFSEVLSGRALRPIMPVAVPIATGTVESRPHPHAEAEPVAADSMPENPAPELARQDEETEQLRREAELLEAERLQAASDSPDAHEVSPLTDAPIPTPAATPLDPVLPAVDPAIAGPAALDLPDHTQLLTQILKRRCRIVLVASVGSNQAARHLTDLLAREVLGYGLSVALVDAGTGQPGDEPGISDLSTGVASFGDVVQKSADIGFAEVPWGRQAALDTRSPKPATLVEALSDIYEVVLVSTGQIGSRSSLSAFTEVADKVVLVSARGTAPAQVQALRAELDAAGYLDVEIVRQPDRIAA